MASCCINTRMTGILYSVQMYKAPTKPDKQNHADKYIF